VELHLLAASDGASSLPLAAPIVSLATISSMTASAFAAISYGVWSWIRKESQRLIFYTTFHTQKTNRPKRKRVSRRVRAKKGQDSSLKETDAYMSVSNGPTS